MLEKRPALKQPAIIHILAVVPRIDMPANRYTEAIAIIARKAAPRRGYIMYSIFILDAIVRWNRTPRIVLDSAAWEA